MSEDIITQLKEVMTPIALKIGEGAEFGWEVVMKQQYVEAVVAFSFLFFGIILLLLGYYLSVKTDWNSRDNNEGKTGVPAMVLLVIGGIITFFAFLTVLFESAIGKLINPEYYAIQFFINLVK